MNIGDPSGGSSMFDVMRFAIGAALWAGICAWAIARGGAAERVGAIAILVNAVVTPFIDAGLKEAQAERAVLGLDFALFAVFVALALRSVRWWTLFAAAFMLCEVLSHVVGIYNPKIIKFYYGSALVFWSYMTLWAIAFGVGQIEYRRWRQWRGRRQASAA
jgi:hypothetical protein